MEKKEQERMIIEGMFIGETFGDRGVMTIIFTTKFDARKGSLNLLRNLKANETPAKIWQYGENRYTGGYEVSFLFEPEVCIHEVLNAFYNNPPPSNRGVTK